MKNKEAAGPWFAAPPVNNGMLETAFRDFSSPEGAATIALMHAGLAGANKINQNPEPGEQGTLPLGRATSHAMKTLAGHAIGSGLLHGMAYGHSGTVPTLLRAAAPIAGAVGGAILPQMKTGSITSKVQELAKLAVSKEGDEYASVNPAPYTNQRKSFMDDSGNVNPAPYTNQRPAAPTAQPLPGPKNNFSSVGEQPNPHSGLTKERAELANFKANKSQQMYPRKEAPKASTGPAPILTPDVKKDIQGKLPFNNPQQAGAAPATASAPAAKAVKAPKTAPSIGGEIPLGTQAMNTLKDVGNYKLPGGARVKSIAPGAAIMGLNAMRGDADNPQGGLAHGLATGAGAAGAGMLAHRLGVRNPLLGGLAQMAGGMLGGKIASVQELAKIAVGAGVIPSGLTSTVTNRPSGIGARKSNLVQGLKDQLKPQGTLSDKLQSVGKTVTAQELAKIAVETSTELAGLESEKKAYCLECKITHEDGKHKRADVNKLPASNPIGATKVQGSNISAYPSAAIRANQARDNIADWVLRNSGQGPIKKANMEMGYAGQTPLTQPAMTPLSPQQRGDMSSGSFGIGCGIPQMPKKAPKKEPMKKEEPKKEASDNMTFTSSFVDKWNRPNTSIGPKLDLYRNAAQMLGKTVDKD